jgi:MFS superfamily sulfate permease-like transporter
MNQNNSYVVPNYPQLTNNIEQNQQMMPNKQNLNTQEQKHLLFFSNYCNHCKNLLSELEKKTVIQNIQLICIDNRQIIDNIIYINLQNGSKMPLPPMINSVPSLCLVPNYEILTGMDIYNYYVPLSKSIQDEREKIECEPNPFSIDLETSGSYGVSSDKYSFWDTDNDDLSASGNGGLRQMYNYVTYDHDIEPIKTINEEIKTDKITMSLEQLQQQRNSQIPINNN